MKLSALGYAEIASYEGICLRPYWDSVGVLTWGVGHTKAAGGIDPADLPRDQDQTMELVLKVFMDDMADVEADVNRLVHVPLKQYEFDGLSSFHFNTGGLARAQLLVELNNGNYAAAAADFMGWLKPPEIRGRRIKEQALFRDATYSAHGMCNVFPVSASGQPLYGKGRIVDVATLLVSMGESRPVPLPPTPVPPFPWPDAPLPTPIPPVTPPEPHPIAAAIGVAILAAFAVAATWWREATDFVRHLFGG